MHTKYSEEYMVIILQTYVNINYITTYTVVTNKNFFIRNLMFLKFILFIFFAI